MHNIGDFVTIIKPEYVTIKKEPCVDYLGNKNIWSSPMDEMIGKKVRITNLIIGEGYEVDNNSKITFNADWLKPTGTRDLLYRDTEDLIKNTPTDILNNINELAEEYTGGSSSYYKVTVKNPVTASDPYEAECLDIIEALGLNFSEGNIIKALWRRANARKEGAKKKGYDEDGKYDAEKILFFAKRIMAEY